MIQSFSFSVTRSSLQSLRSKYIVKYQNVVGSDGLIFATNSISLRQATTTRRREKGTVSGRFSSSGGRSSDPFGVNVQQVFSIDNQKKTLVSKWMIRRL
jgi:hypothetical protein